MVYEHVNLISVQSTDLEDKAYKQFNKIRNNEQILLEKCVEFASSYLPLQMHYFTNVDLFLCNQVPLNSTSQNTVLQANSIYEA